MPRRAADMKSILSGQCLGGVSLNTGRMTDLVVLAATLLSNFLTVRFPRNAEMWRVLDEDLSFEVRIRCLSHALRGELLSVGCHRHSLRLGLVRHGLRQFLDYVEGDPAGGWRIHLFLFDASAISIVPLITEGDVGPGDPVHFDPKQFVQRRLERLGILRRLTGGCDWLDDDIS
jgi:hypothetical protein